jgi:hypothetical protein
MDELYQPPSDFLRAVADEQVPLSGSAFAEENFRRLLNMMTDKERGNRDWATLLVAQHELDTDAVRNALIGAAQDDDQAVRAEAILGLAQRDPKVALPFLKIALSEQNVMPPVFEAAALVADASLVDDLRQFSAPSGDTYLDQLATDALAACEREAAAKSLNEK